MAHFRNTIKKEQYLGSLFNREEVYSEEDISLPETGKQYFIDGKIEITQSIPVPSGKIEIVGQGVDISELKLVTEDISMFINNSGSTSGSITIKDLTLDASITKGRIFELIAETGFEVIVLENVKFQNCDSLGTISGFAFEIERNVSRIGGNPSLIFAGAFGGIRWDFNYISTTNVGLELISADPTLTFNSANRVSLSMAGTFVTGQVISTINDSMFSRGNSFLLKDCDLVGVDTIEDLFPNLALTNNVLKVINSTGIENTYPGIVIKTLVQTNTVLTSANTNYDLLVANIETVYPKWFSPYVTTHLEFEYNGEEEEQFEIRTDLSIDGASGDACRILLMYYDASETTTTQIDEVYFEFPLAGTGSIGNYAIRKLSQGDRVKVQITTTETNSPSVTLQEGSKLIVNPR